jgi:hypothetical protein
MSRRENRTAQLTLRGFDPELERHVRDLARREGISLNKAVLRLARKGARLEDTEARCDLINDRLDDLIGTWSDEEAEAMTAATALFEQVDEGLWR